MKKHVQFLTNPPPIEDVVNPCRWLKGYYDEDMSPKGFFMPKEGTEGYKFLTDASEECFVEGPYGIGKSQILAFKVHHFALNHPKSRCAFIRKTKESVKGSIIPTYYRILGYNPTDTDRQYVVGYGGANPQWFDYRNGSKILILGLNRMDDFHSTEFNCMGIPQAEELTYDEWQLVARRTRLGGRTMVFGDVNPSFPQHFLNNTGHIKRYKMIHRENPDYYHYYTGLETDKGVREIAKLQRLTGVRYLRGYLGEWVAQEGVVYSMYDYILHDEEVRRDDFGVDVKWNMSIDYGYQNPWACGFFAQTPDGVHHHFKEIYRTQINLDDFINRIRKVQRDFDLNDIQMAFADHDAEHNDRMRLEGFPIVEAEKEVLPGIELMKSHLENGTIKFNKFSMTYWKDESGHEEGPDEGLFGLPKCLRDELVAYAYIPPNKRTFTDKDEYPIPKYNHGCDYTRYYLKGMENPNIYFPINSSSTIGGGDAYI